MYRLVSIFNLYILMLIYFQSSVLFQFCPMVFRGYSPGSLLRDLLSAVFKGKCSVRYRIQSSCSKNVHSTPNPLSCFSLSHLFFSCQGLNPRFKTCKASALSSLLLNVTVIMLIYRSLKLFSLFLFLEEEVQKKSIYIFLIVNICKALSKTFFNLSLHQQTTCFQFLAAYIPSNDRFR